MLCALRKKVSVFFNVNILEHVFGELSLVSFFFFFLSNQCTVPIRLLNVSQCNGLIKL